MIRLGLTKTFKIRDVNDLHSVQLYLKKSFQGTYGSRYYDIQYVIQELIQNMLDENEHGVIRIARTGNVELRINLSSLPNEEKERIWQKLLSALERCKHESKQPEGRYSTKGEEGRGLGIVSILRSGWNIIPSMNNSKILLRAMYA